MSTNRTLALVFILLALGSADVALAQRSSPGAIRVRVTDSTAHPIRDAEAVITGTSLRAVSDSTGFFLLTGIESGRHQLVVRHVGYDPLMLNANVFTDDTIEATIVLHRQPTALAPVVTEATQIMRPSLAEFEARRKVGIGTFITQSELAKHAGDRVSDVLRGQITGVRYVERSCGGLALANGAPATVALSDSKPIAVAGCTVPKLCYFQLYVDGVHMYSYDGATMPPDIDQFLLDQVDAIEVYGGGARTPAQFNSTGAACGTIVIWMKR